MGLFDLFKKKKKLLDLSYINTMDIAREEFKKGNLEKVFLVSPMFGGSEKDDNIVYVPKGIKQVKEGYDRILARFIEEGNKISFNCKLEYKNESVIPCKILLISSKNGEDAITKTINVW